MQAVDRDGKLAPLNSHCHRTIADNQVVDRDGNLAPLNFDFHGKIPDKQIVYRDEISLL